MKKNFSLTCQNDKFIKEVDVSENNIGDDGCKAFSEALLYNSTIESIVSVNSFIFFPMFLFNTSFMKKINELI